MENKKYRYYVKSFMDNGRRKQCCVSGQFFPDPDPDPGDPKKAGSDRIRILPHQSKNLFSRNSQLLGQMDVGTVCIQFDRPTRLPAAGT